MPGCARSTASVSASTPEWSRRRAPYLDPAVPRLLAAPPGRRCAPEHRAQILLELSPARAEQARRRIGQREDRRYDLVLAALGHRTRLDREPDRPAEAGAGP